MKRYNDIPQILKDFLTYHETIKGQSQLTISEYYLDLRMFLRFIKLMRNDMPINTSLEDIDIRNFTLDEIDKAYNQDVVQRLLKLIDFRNEYPAFDGEFTVEPSNDNEIILTWKKADKYCTLNVDLTTSKSTIKYINDDGDTSLYPI